jgi:hypothetical protein
MTEHPAASDDAGEGPVTAGNLATDGPPAEGRGRPPSARTRVRRLPELADYERGTIDAILDAGMVCHLGFVHDGQPYVVPTLHARVGDELLVHGSAASRTLGALGGGTSVCVTVTLVDGIVLARSVFESSMNYRSVMLLGRARVIEGSEGKLRALEAFSEQLLPGRWADARRPTEQELKATTVLAVPIEEASAKISAGPPDDGDTPDARLPIWAGVIPLVVAALPAVPAPELPAGVEMPAYVRDFERAGLTTPPGA